MKTNIIITIITGLLTLTACNGTTTPKTEKEKQVDRYEAAFRNYVATDFDDPASLVEVTNIEVNDTTKPLMELVTTMDDIIVTFGMDAHKKELDDIAARLEKEKGLVFFEVKARVMIDKRPMVMSYYGYENLTDGTIKISNEMILVHDPLLPAAYKDLVKFTEDLQETLGIR